MRWRTGHKNARNIYLLTADGDEIHVGVMFTEALGRHVADTLNARDINDDPPIPGGDIGNPVTPVTPQAHDERA